MALQVVQLLAKIVLVGAVGIVGHINIVDNVTITGMLMLKSIFPLLEVILQVRRCLKWFLEGNNPF